MKLLYISKNYHPFMGGGEISTHTMMKLLTRRGYECHALCFRDQYQIPFIIDEDLDIEGVHVYKRTQESNQNIESKIEEIKPDYVLTQSIGANRYIEISKKFNIPTILGVHFYFNILNASQMSFLISRPKSTVKILYNEHQCFHMADKVYVNSNHTYQIVEKYVGIKPDTTIIPVIDIEKIEFDVDEYDPKYITIVKPDYGKGGEIFIQLALSFPNLKFAAVNMDFLNIPHNIKISSMISDIDNIDQFNFTENMKDIYSKTKILLMPSTVDESFSMTTLEAMWNGIPIIGSTLGNLPYLISKAGFVFDPSNINGFKKAIVQLTENPIMYNKLSENGIKQSRQYDPEYSVSEFEKLLQL